MQIQNFQIGYSIPVYGQERVAMVNNGHVSLSTVRTSNILLPVSVRSYSDRFPHTGMLTGSDHVFYEYPNGVILGTHGGNLLTKLSDKATVNALLRKNNAQAFM